MRICSQGRCRYKKHALLNVVHKLIEDHQIRFALTGSSARKLKRGHAILTRGRQSVAFEVKATSNVDDVDLAKFEALAQDIPGVSRLLLVSQEPKARRVGKVEALPRLQALKELEQGPF